MNKKYKKKIKNLCETGVGKSYSRRSQNAKITVRDSKDAISISGSSV